ncbi:hypothetical protein PUNSTDRAFT_142322 [Punctularia strigosozonata HHB-11173 SS5]|uniref:uncharacterized protein n=1 Tax=Punctularia strigosozonata (strain HHB-11173) TaxID=741275 RepID=UPI000441688A|nr:uncharacterized protein PUNSTDRAFT_142322 [Punctularia strigosozonata HHB-11173 SS5]EIN10255.1 hypothetical protein PUNSTDRAFT_142322 [Punctularia strigosozonata HHB-11173 SS5]
MQGEMHDPHLHKRTSINQLLNPVAAGATPTSLDHAAYHPHPHHHHHPQQQQQQQYVTPPPPPAYHGPGNAYGLRAATWSTADNANGSSPPQHQPQQQQQQQPRKQEEGGGCVYQHPPPMHYNPYAAPDQPRRYDPQQQQQQQQQHQYPAQMQMSPWAHHDGSGAVMHYAAAAAPPMAIAHMYSDERTAVPGDYANGGAAAAYQAQAQERQQQDAQMMQQQQQTSQTVEDSKVGHDYQNGERASVRLAARSTMPAPMQYSPGYMAYYPGGIPAGMPFNMMSFAPYPHAVAMAAMPSPSPAPALKRAAEEEQDEEEPPPTTTRAKRAKKTAAAKDGGASAATKRGYTAKKREAAQVAAQNAKMMPTAAFPAGSGGENGSSGPDAAAAPSSSAASKSGSSTSAIAKSSSSSSPSSDLPSPGQLHPELQFARCMSNRYRPESFPRCVSCTRRWAGDTCRFQGIRFFLKDESRNIVGISFVENQKQDAPTMCFPNSWNVPLEARHTRTIKRTVAKALLPTLKQEMEHMKAPDVIRRPRESDVRATCDTCMTSIFSTSWMCRLCGREACAECFAQVRELTKEQPGAGHAEVAALQARREKHAHANPFFLSCTRRSEHGFSDFSPVSRFHEGELAEAVKEMEAIAAADEETDGSVAAGGEVVAADGEDGRQQAPTAGKPTSSSSSSDAAKHPAPETSLPTPPPTTLTPTPPEPVTATVTVKQQEPDGVPALPAHDVPYYTAEELSEDLFREVWARGEPLVVTGLGRKFAIEWTPAYFVEKYGSQACLVVECQTEANKRTNVADFFGQFGKYEGREKVWKLKDWPPSTDFKTAFPELYDDFSNVVPAPSYSRRDGAYNIASHFPSNTIAPDLGPKMYNAMANFETAGSHGSTKLHMDMADAVNVMTYTERKPDGTEGCAVWDLFKAEDSDKIRKFLRDKFSIGAQHDPIHSQSHYLDSQLRAELWKKTGVKSFRVYQKPGEAVFIPAGCAHQVCNLADCIKVATDFVSPENIERCEKLTREFREQNQSMVWKEDVLQLRTMMWFAWLSCCRQEKQFC